METLESLNSRIAKEMEDFNREASKHTQGNKAAGARARKFSLAIEKMLKDYRKISIEADK